MQTKIMGLFIVLGLALMSLACAQGEKQEQGETPASAETQATTDDDATTEDKAETHDKAETQGEVTGHSHGSSELHGGSVVMTPKHHFEVVFGSEEVRVYGYDGAQNPINEMQDAKATLKLQKRDGDQMELALSYVGPDLESGRSQGYFTAPYEFGDVAEDQMKATFTMSGMSGMPVTFKTAVSVSTLVTYACPMHPEITGEDPVDCSICGMALTKQEQGDHDTDEHEGHGH